MWLMSDTTAKVLILLALVLGLLAIFTGGEDYPARCADSYVKASRSGS